MRVRWPRAEEERQGAAKRVHWADASSTSKLKARRKEQLLMAVVEDKHRVSPVQKQRSANASKAMVALGQERLRKTAGFGLVDQVW